MQPESRKLLLDARDASASIQGFVIDRDYDDLVQDKMFRSAVYYQFAIIGEALSQLRHIDEKTFDRISESRKIVGFRNQIIHGYGGMQDNVTWQIIQEKLPLLQKELEMLLHE